MRPCFIPSRPTLTVLSSVILATGMAVAQPYVPPAGMNLNANAYAPGAIQPPLPPTPPRPPSGPPPPGFNYPNGAYQPPGLRAPAPKTSAPASKSKTSTTAKSTAKSPSYRPPTGKSTGSTASLESRVGKLESSDRRQDLRLGRIERDVGLLPSGGGVTDIHQGGNTHTVKPGDTLFSIAARHGTSVGELRALNHLDSDRVGIGTVLLLPEPGGGKTAPLTSSAVVHIVADNENIGSIARAYGVSEAAIAKANPSAYASDLRDGERLVIPNPTRLPQQHAPSLPRHFPDADSDQDAQAVVNTIASSTHKVKKGESLSKIAAMHRVSMSTLMAANKIKNPNKILLGQRLVIPGKKITRTLPQEPAPRPVQTIVAADSPAPPVPPQQPGPSPLKGADTAASSQPAMPRGIVSYRMQRGDSLESVANLFSSTVENIRAMNKHLPAGNPGEGTEIFVPTVGAISLN